MDKMPTKTKPKYLIKRVKRAFDKGLNILESSGFELISTWREAQLRMKSSCSVDILNNDNWVREGILYQKRENTRLLLEGLCLNHPEQATQAHRERRKFTLEDYSHEVEKARQNGLEVRREDLKRNGNVEIPLKRFGSNRYAIFLFGGKGSDKTKSKRAQNYGRWLLDSTRDAVSFLIYLSQRSVINKQEQPFASQFWIGNSDSLCLGGNYSDILHQEETKLLGIKKSGRTTKKSRKHNQVRPYTLEQVWKSKEIVNGVRHGDLPASKLEETLSFLESLRFKK